MLLDFFALAIDTFLLVDLSHLVEALWLALYKGLFLKSMQEVLGIILHLIEPHRL